MFCVTVYFQAEFSDLEVLSIEAIFNALINGMCISIFTRLVWYKKLI